MTPSAHRVPGPRRVRLLLALAVLLLLLALFPLRRALQLSAAPAAPKDCAPAGPARVRTDAAAVQVRAQPELPWLQKGGTINDASCLNRTSVHGIVDVRTEDDIREALMYAREHGLKVSIAGVRHSMGGQAFAVGALILDMRRFNRIDLDAETRTVTVQSGATWHEIQNVLHPRFAVKAVQSTDIFTVGGSISVNAHGMDHRAGSVGRTICTMRVMLPDGSVRTVSRTQEPQLFQLVVGGYGLFGIILDAELEITDNVVYQSERRVMSHRDFPGVLDRDIAPDDRVGLLYGHLSTSPGTLLEEMLLYTYRRVDAPDAEIPPLGEVGTVRLRRLVFNLSKLGPGWMRIKWLAEKHLEPRLEACPVSRNEAMGQAEGCFVSRNHPMHDSVTYLQNSLPEETDILQEYFIPRSAFVEFVDELRTILRAEQANLLNASVRVVHREDNALSYAPSDDMLAVVLYLNQGTGRADTERMARLTGRLIELCSGVGGRFFLPYQLHYTAEQLERAYPEIRAWFAAKDQVDPETLLTNTFYERFAREFTISSDTAARAAAGAV
jgi:FAD/FMN-containing dehydrogenase